MGDSKTKEQKSFAEKHPRINFLLGLIIFAILLFLAIFVLLRVISFIQTSIANISQATSKMEAVVIVALITVAISLVTVIINSIFGKILDHKKSRQAYLAQKREDAYKHFIEMVYRIQETTRDKNAYPIDDMLEDVKLFSKDLTLWGSPKVIDKWNEFRIKSADKTDNSNVCMFILEEIMNEMRKDMGCKKVKKGSLLSFFVNDIKDYIK